MNMEDRMPYPFAPQDIEESKHTPPAKGRKTGAQRRSYAAEPKRKGKGTLEEQAKLFQKLEVARARIAELMLRYPKLTGTIVPGLTEKAWLPLFTKTTEWALVLEALLRTQRAPLDSTPSLDSLSAASQQMLRIHHIGDAEMERFIAALEDCVERLLLAETHFEIQARDHVLSQTETVRLKESDRKGEPLPPDHTDTLAPLIEEIELIEKEAGASSKEMKEDLATVLRVRRDLHSAKNAAVEANLRLVIRMARKYFHAGIPFQDLVQEGNLGLMRAVDKFDYRLGYKFSTYANWWIKQAITRAIYAQGHIIRLPYHLVQKAGKAQRSSSARVLETGNFPPPEEVAREVGISPLKLESILQALRRRLISMETPVLEGKAEMRDFIVDPGSVSPEDAVIHKDVNMELRALLEILDRREKLILMKRFGIGGEEEQSLRELSKEFGVTPERIRQIVKKAMEKIRRRIEALESHCAFTHLSKVSN